MNIVPPYLNRLLNQKEKEWHKAQEKRMQKQKEYEFAVEYENICKERYEEAKRKSEK